MLGESGTQLQFERQFYAFECGIESQTVNDLAALGTVSTSILQIGNQIRCKNSIFHFSVYK
jgi:hypothetical protein